MKNLSKIIILILIAFSFFIIPTSLSYADIQEWDEINTTNGWLGGNDRNTYLETFWNDADFFTSANGWEKGAYYVLVAIAKDLKNLFFMLATIFLLIIVIKVIFWENSEEEIWKFKKWIIWITAWLIVMQAAYAFSQNLYNKQITESTASAFITAMITPIIELLYVLTSIFFIWIAIYAFFRLVTANWNEENVKTWKMTIIYAIVWYVVISFAEIIVGWVYSKTSTVNPDTDWFVITMMEVINWMNWFVWIIVVLMIIYTWFQVLLSAWDEEKLKKAKSTILYIIIWLTLLVFNRLILTFFIIPEAAI